MRAVALIGGEGTRLRPLTYSRPKALVPIAGYPFLVRFIQHLRRHGVDELALAGSRGAAEIEASFGQGETLGVRLAYIDEPIALGSGGAIRNCASFLGAETFLVANGDIMTGIDLSAMVEQHRATRAVVTIALTCVEDPTGYGVARIDDESAIRAFVEKPAPGAAPSRWANAGLWLFEPGVVDRIPEGRSMVETDLFPALIAAGERVYGYRSRDAWIDIGTVARYLQANRDALAAEGSVRTDDEAIVESGARLEAPVVVGRGTIVRDGAVVTGPTALGVGCDIAAAAEVSRSVLWDGVRVEHGGIVSDSALADDVVIGAGAVVRDAALGHGARVEPGSRPPAGLRLDPGDVYPRSAAT